MTCPWICFAGEPPELSLSSSFEIKNRQSLESMDKALKSTGMKDVTVTCSNFTWTLWDVPKLLWTIIPSLRKVLKQQIDLRTVTLNVSADTKDMNADGIASYLISLLGYAPHIEHLSVSGTFTKKSMPLLASYIRKNPNLKSIVLLFRLEDEGIRELIGAIENHPGLTDLSLGPYYFNEELAVALGLAFKSCPDLTRVRVLHNSPGLAKKVIENSRITEARIGYETLCQKKRVFGYYS